MSSHKQKDNPEEADPAIFSPVHRISTSSNALTMTSSIPAPANENETEMFSGAASIVVPSSISTFHHHSKSIKSPSSFSSAAPIMSHGAFLLDEPFEEEVLGLEKIRTNATELGDRANFHFFTTDEIESAKGVSSIRRTVGNQSRDSVPVDYDTNWNTYEDDYNSDAITESDGPASSSRGSGSGYGSIEGSDNDECGYHERRMTYDAEEELVREQEETDKVAGTNLRTDVKFHDQLFSKQFPAKNMYQRFYLAEEDLVIGIAGYKTIRLRLLLYHLLCVCTFGLGYLLLRWLPRQRLNMEAKPTPLAKSDHVVIEDQYGLLDVIPLRRIWYNKKLSTFLPVDSIEGREKRTEPLSIDDIDPFVPILICFEYRYMKFFYDPRDDLFKLSNNWVDERWCHYPDIKDGIAEETYKARRDIFDVNVIKIKEKSIIQLLRDEVLHPFYVFQVFSILLWLADSYVYYAFCIFIISLFSIGESLIETKTNMSRMRKLAIFQCPVRVFRNGFWKETTSDELVPGDVYEVSDPSLSVFPCDSLLLEGDCIVNESMLTGESVPVSKVAISPDIVSSLNTEFNSAKFSPRFAKSFLYNGTKIVRCRYGSHGARPATALVIRTGFNTTKGALVRSMLFPKPVGFKFYEDSFKYIGVMGIIACFGFIFSIANFIKLKVDTRTIIFRALDIITIVVPPALPATLTIGTSFALARLRKKNIFCIAPTRLNVGGKLDVACFDKTGTLTEEGLDVMGVRLSRPVEGRRGHQFSQLLESADALLGDSDHVETKELFDTMLTCHSLKKIDDELIGDPLDIKMFEFVHCQMADSPNEDDDLGAYIQSHRLPEGSSPIVFHEGNELVYQLKEYEFISHLRRMSTICQFADSPSNLHVYVKGAPEVMVDICRPETLPVNFQELLYEYTHSGYRVIACATKVFHNSLDKKNPEDLRFLSEWSREKVESDLDFVGFIVFENRLKPTTAATLKQLREANMRTVMCTGDNVLTAVSVAKECSLVEPDSKVYIASFNYEIPVADEFETTPPIVWIEVDHPELQLDPTTLAPLDVTQDDNYTLAVTGDVFRYILTNAVEMEYYIEKMLMRSSIFARMSPDEKHELVERLRALDYTVGFCGDGANDCGALKAADVGISLSEAEASVAAPFTSRVFEVSCVLDVIKEGRASLVTSFSCFQYMSLYSAIQFISVSVLYKEGVNLGDFQFLYIDLFLIIPIAVFMSWSKPYPVVCAKRPTANLISPKIIIPLLGSIIVELIFQIFAWKLGKRESEPWYVKPVPGNDEAVKSTDNSVVFTFANFQYIFAALMLTVGPPYREAAIKNIPFIVTVLAAFIISALLMLVDPASKFGDLMDLTWFPLSITRQLLIGAVVNYIVLEFSDKCLCVKLSQLYKKLFGTKESKKRFKNLKREFNRSNQV